MKRYDKEQMPYPLFRESDLEHQMGEIYDLENDPGEFNNL